VPEASSTSSRDRDATGRARNARPRDELGRPLPRQARGVPGASEEALAPAEALSTAQQLLHEGRPFHAHEVLEAAWKAAPAAERDLWQGLAQVAVGLTHALRGNPRGAVALLHRGAARLSGYPAHGPHDVDVAGVQRACAELTARIEASGTGALRPRDTDIRLRVRDH
jgi:uncharacterized protein